MYASGVNTIVEGNELDAVCHYETCGYIRLLCSGLVEEGMVREEIDCRLDRGSYHISQ